MRHLRVVLLAWLVTGIGAVVGSLVGGMFGRQGMFIGTMVGGTLALLAAIGLLASLGWLDPERRRGGSIGGLVGFALASPFIFMNLDTPIVPIGVTLLVGAGVVLGAGRGAVR
jgi:hypothetical protein